MDSHFHAINVHDISALSRLKSFTKKYGWNLDSDLCFSPSSTEKHSLSLLNRKNNVIRAH
ncbi:CLUMA_CG020636, isoform A [Clunio marinus]|uniref:CLUMA_CG020636, isoform A n=1 Tax=Clunio marinus TaxID=568069 RepID=A0A1J1J5K8_9DIPT|nr:CLUMA_CG020636, isoform A [Clunio marinus]